MAPNLSTEETLNYISEENTFIRELLEDAGDCKWVYQALIDNVLLSSKVTGTQPKEAEELESWLQQLKKLDPLRQGRWDDLRRSLDVC